VRVRQPHPGREPPVTNHLSVAFGRDLSARPCAGA